MSTKRATDWERYAVVGHIADTLKDSNDLGRKAIQKIVYLFQEVGGMPLGFGYMFYTYGVYSVELANTLSAVESMGGIEATYDRAQNSYHLQPGKNLFILNKHGSNFLSRHAQAMDRVFAIARGQTAKSLELVSTIIYVSKTENLSARKHEEELLSRVGELKPKFGAHEIKSKVDELRKGGYL
jgi:uncharacterized protein YwgA